MVARTLCVLGRSKQGLWLGLYADDRRAQRLTCQLNSWVLGALCAFSVFGLVGFSAHESYTADASMHAHPGSPRAITAEGSIKTPTPLPRASLTPQTHSASPVCPSPVPDSSVDCTLPWVVTCP